MKNKFRKSALTIAAIVLLSASLGGCIVVPGPYYYGHGGGYGHYHR